MNGAFRVPARELVRGRTVRSAPLGAARGRRWAVRRVVQVAEVRAAPARRPAGSGGGSHYLVPRAPEIADRHAQHVHQAGEREDDEDGEPEKEVQLEHGVRARDVADRCRIEGEDALRPHHQLHHFLPVEMPERNRDGEDGQGRAVPTGSRSRGCRRTRTAPAPLHRRNAGGRACSPRRGPPSPATPPTTIAMSSLKPWLMPSASKTWMGVRRPTRWPTNTINTPDVEQHRPRNELAAAEDLARSRAPGVGLPVVTHDGADHEDGERNVGIDAEQQGIEIAGHGLPSSSVFARPGAAPQSAPRDPVRVRRRPPPGADLGRHPIRPAGRRCIRTRPAERHRLLLPHAVEGFEVVRIVVRQAEQLFHVLPLRLRPRRGPRARQNTSA